MFEFTAVTTIVIGYWIEFSVPNLCFDTFRRDPSSMVNGKRKESAGDGGNPDGENNKPKATRYICLIRHSQYNLKGEGDKERILTPLGTEHILKW